MKSWQLEFGLGTPHFSSY